MTFGRWLLVHSLSISILVMLGVGYFFKNELKLNEAYSQLLEIDKKAISLAAKPATEESASKEPASKELVSKEPALIELVKPAPIQARIAAVQEKEKKAIVKVEPSAIYQEAPVDVFDETASKAKLDTSNLPSTLKATKEAPQFSNNTKESEQPVDFLLLARQAYWDENYQLALENYEKELEKMPNSPDLYGEIGNLYYGLKRFDLASTNYLEAGKIMLELNDQARAKKIYDILISIAPDKAEMLLSIKNDKYQ